MDNSPAPARRQTPSQRHNIHRRAERKRKLIRFLSERGMLPADPKEFDKLLEANRWPVPTDESEYKRVSASPNGPLAPETSPLKESVAASRQPVNRRHAPVVLACTAVPIMLCHYGVRAANADSAIEPGLL